MSHFIVNLILPPGEVYMEKIEEILEPYNENRKVESYVSYYRCDAKKLQKKELDRLKEILHSKDENYKLDICQKEYDRIKSMTAEQYYHSYFEGAQKDKKGNILSTYNPDSKWDWWEVGGRYAGWLLNLPDGKASNKIKDNCCTSGQAMEEKKIPFALILPNGKWLERGKMGWWAVVTDELPDKEWEKIVLKNYKKYPQYMVVQIDCHI